MSASSVDNAAPIVSLICVTVSLHFVLVQILNGYAVTFTFPNLPTVTNPLIGLQKFFTHLISGLGL